MSIPLQINVHDIAPSDALDARIREKVAGLERFHSRITSCRVTVRQSGRHHQQGRRFEVTIEVHVPGRAEIVSSRHDDEDVYVALRDAFAATTRQLEDAAREDRGDVKRHVGPKGG